jgi:hypothetical protein
MDINHLTVEELKIVKDAINQKINQLGDNTSQEETLEEAAFHYSKNKINKNTSLLDFTKGAKWQAERMYSEEEVLDLLNKREDYLDSEDNIFDYQSINQWFEQFKKK